MYRIHKAGKSTRTVSTKQVKDDEAGGPHPRADVLGAEGASGQEAVERGQHEPGERAQLRHVGQTHHRGTRLLQHVHTAARLGTT